MPGIYSRNSLIYTTIIAYFIHVDHHASHNDQFSDSISEVDPVSWTLESQS